jgi:hypothetical protein
MSISTEDNPGNLTPIQYLARSWQINPIAQGDEYVIDELEAQQKMIGKIKKYKEGDIEGVIVDAGESEHPLIISSHDGKIYTFQYLPGGQTGSRISNIAKETLNQTLATFKYTN